VCDRNCKKGGRVVASDSYTNRQLYKTESAQIAWNDREKAIKFLEEALGVVAQKTKKPEYHQHSSRVSQQRIGG
jgi:hypothetical protein